MAEHSPEVLLYLVDAGGGHRATANALVAAAAQRRCGFRIGVKSIREVLAPFDVGRLVTGRSLEDHYNAMVRGQRTRHLASMLKAFQWTIRALRPRLVRTVAADLARHRPALVVSLFPNFNGVLAEAVRAAHPGVPFHVLLTDFADLPPAFWIEPGIDGVIVATEEAERQAAEMGMKASQIARTSGMVLHPRFYPRASAEGRRRTRRDLGLPDDEPVVLVLFGGKGSPEMTALCEALLRHAPQARVVAICGDNRELLFRVTRLSMDSCGRLRPLGFTDRVAELLGAADLLLTKPGPGSLAEAFHQQVPVVVCCNAHTIPQERFNVRFVEDKGLGVAVEGWKEMAPAAARLLSDPPALARFRQNLGRVPENRAVYEVLDLIAATVEPAPQRSASWTVGHDSEGARNTGARCPAP
jgi:UDP-N-acetylglucosamine:LPS N-acetylglucosamine transferase